MKSIVLYPDGRKECVETNGYDDFKRIIDGWIEVVPIDGFHALYCDEEGILKNLQINKFATNFFHNVIDIGLRPDDKLVGTIVITGQDENGEQADCTTAMWNFINGNEVYVIFNEKEKAFWSNQYGWVEFTSATVFDYDEQLNLPVGVGPSKLIKRSVAKNININQPIEKFNDKLC